MILKNIVPKRGDFFKKIYFSYYNKYFLSHCCTFVENCVIIDTVKCLVKLTFKIPSK